MKIRNAQQYQDALNKLDNYATVLRPYDRTWQDAARLDAAISLYELNHAENHSKRDRRTPRG